MSGPAPQRYWRVLAMTNVMLILLLVFGGVALMVVLGERFAKPVDPQRMRQLRRWMMPLVGVMLLLSLIDYYV
jgi:hypothetical protein